MNNFKCLCFVAVVILSQSQTDAVTAGQRQRHVIENGQVTEIISHSVTSGVSSNVLERSHQRRKRGENSVSDDDAQNCLDKHNNLRKDEGAANMRKMAWDDDLADLAQEWADLCDFVHGQPGSHPTYNQIGQNLYITSADSVNIENAIQAWFNEKTDYTYDTNDCEDGRACGHYTQVVWADSFLLGCGVAQCAPLTDSDAGTQWNSGTYLVCNYATAGNGGGKPFTEGTACTKCSTGVFNCSPDGLCVDDCESETCECKACSACENCATIEDDCTCTCQDGYTGVDCSEPCEDTHANCDSSPGWPPFWCTEDRQYVLKGCPLMCELCREGTGEPTGVCDNGCPDDPDSDGGDSSASVTRPQLQCVHAAVVLVVSLYVFMS